MDFVDAVRVVLRRWRVIVVGLIAVAAAGGAAIFLIPTNYQAAAQVVLLLPSQATGAGTPTNPYLNLDPGLTVSASLIASSASTKDAQRSMKAAGFTAEYAIGLDPGAGPILQVSAEDHDPAMAVRTRDEAIRRMQSELSQLQADVSAPQRQLIQARTISLPEVAEPLPGSKIRALAAIAGVGGVVTLLVAFLRDRRLVGTPPPSSSRPGPSGPPPVEKPDGDAPAAVTPLDPDRSPESSPREVALAGSLTGGSPPRRPDGTEGAQRAVERTNPRGRSESNAHREVNGHSDLAGRSERAEAATSEVQWWDA